MTNLDHATMSVGLEARLPLLDGNVIEFAGRLPDSLRARRGRPKHLLRGLLARKIGEDFVERRKHGFRVPVQDWLRERGVGRLTEEIFSDGVGEWLDRGRLGKLLYHPRGTELARPFVMFSHWHRAFRPEPPV